MRLNDEDMQALDRGTALASQQQRAKDEIDLLRAKLSALQELCGAAYQAVGAAEGPEEMLDNLSDAASGRPIRHALGAGLPWVPDPVPAQPAVPDGFVRASYAIEICRQEAAEWDSDNLVTNKNYAASCADRIALLAAAKEGKP